MKKRNQAGFSLIELLVVISMIGIISVIGLTIFSNTSQKARDNRRKADLEQIRSALEMYRADEGNYPSSISFGGSLSGSLGTYMKEVPDDSKTDYSYVYDRTTPSSYCLCAHLEGASSTYPCACTGCGGTGCNYSLENP